MSQKVQVPVSEVAYWVKAKSVQYGYSAFGTLLVVKPLPRKPGLRVPSRTTEIHFPNSPVHTFIKELGREHVVQVEIVSRPQTAATYNTTLSCGHVLEYRRFYINRQSIIPVKDMSITCPICHNN